MARKHKMFTPKYPKHNGLLVQKLSEIKIDFQEILSNGIDGFDWWAILIRDSYYNQYKALEYIEHIDKHISDSVMKCQEFLALLYKHVSACNKYNEIAPPLELAKGNDIKDIRKLTRYLKNVVLYIEKMDVKYNQEVRKFDSTDILNFIRSSISLNKKIMNNLETTSQSIIDGINISNSHKSDIDVLIKKIKESKKVIDQKAGKSIPISRAIKIKRHGPKAYGFKELKKALQEEIDKDIEGYRHIISDGALKAALKSECGDLIWKSGKELPKSKNRYGGGALDTLIDYFRERIPISAVSKYLGFRSIHTFRRYLKMAVIAYQKNNETFHEPHSHLIPYLLDYYKNDSSGKRKKNMYFTRVMVDDIYHIYTRDENREKLFRRNVINALRKPKISTKQRK